MLRAAFALIGLAVAALVGGQLALPRVAERRISEDLAASGKVTRVEEGEVNLEIAPSVNVRVVKGMIAEVRNRTAIAANDSKA